MEHPLTIARTELLHVEHRARVEAVDGGTQIEMDIEGRALLVLHLNIDGVGRWELRGEFGLATGESELAKPKS